MSYPNPNPFPAPPFTANDSGNYWSLFTIPTNDQPGSNPQPDNNLSFKRQKLSENPVQFLPMNPRPNPSNVPGNKGTSHIFYKTRICARFIEGMCRSGEQCTFAHGPADLREPPRNWQELVREKDTGAGDEHRPVHRMKICNKYYNGEECPYGDRCTFVHQRAPGHPSNMYNADASVQRQSNVIRLGVASEPRRIGVDVDQTSAWKTKICGNWEMGQCPYGERCTFAHGYSELKPSSAADEVAAMTATNAISIPRKAHSVASFNVAPANNATASDAPNASKWKPTKRINRIYGDWLDDGSPPRDSSFPEE